MHCQHFGELVLALNRQYPAEWRKWLTQWLGQDSFPSSHATPEQKKIFFMKVTKERVNKRSIQDAVAEFAFACRNMSGSEYAASTSKRI